MRIALKPKSEQTSLLPYTATASIKSTWIDPEVFRREHIEETYHSYECLNDCPDGDEGCPTRRRYKLCA